MAEEPNAAAAAAPAAPAAAAAPPPAPTAAPAAPAAPGAAPPAAAPAAAATAPAATILTAPPADPNAPPAPKEADSPAPPAPIEYAEFRLPDGVTADAEALASFKDVARGLGLQQAQAQQLVELYAGRQLAAAQAQQAAQQQLVEGWAAAARSDPEFGGAKFDVSVTHAARAMERFATPELRGVLNATGFGNHPEVIRAFVRIGALLGESTHVAGNGPAQAPRSAAERMYPSMAKR